MLEWTAWLRRLNPPGAPGKASSLLAIGVNSETFGPVYIAKRVSKLEPSVLRVSTPSVGATKVHQTDLPPALPAWSGSPVSLVAGRRIWRFDPPSRPAAEAAYARACVGRSRA